MASGQYEWMIASDMDIRGHVELLERLGIQNQAYLQGLQGYPEYCLACFGLHELALQPLPPHHIIVPDVDGVTSITYAPWKVSHGI